MCVCGNCAHASFCVRPRSVSTRTVTSGQTDRESFHEYAHIRETNNPSCGVQRFSIFRTLMSMICCSTFRIQVGIFLFLLLINSRSRPGIVNIYGIIVSGGGGWKCSHRCLSAEPFPRALTRMGNCWRCRRRRRRRCKLSIISALKSGMCVCVCACVPSDISA